MHDEVTFWKYFASLQMQNGRFPSLTTYTRRSKQVLVPNITLEGNNLFPRIISTFKPWIMYLILNKMEALDDKWIVLNSFYEILNNHNIKITKHFEKEHIFLLQYIILWQILKLNEEKFISSLSQNLKMDFQW